MSDLQELTNESKSPLVPETEKLHDSPMKNMYAGFDGKKKFSIETENKNSEQLEPNLTFD
jgi:hypothetical protein